MGISYYVVLPTEQVLGWCAQRGHYFVLPAGSSRFPTPLEIRTVLETLQGCTVNYRAEVDLWEAHVTEHDESAGRSYSYLLGSPFTGDESVPFPYISFDKGNPNLHLRILVRLAARCGPLLLVPNDGIPALAIPESVVWPEGVATNN